MSQWMLRAAIAAMLSLGLAAQSDRGTITGTVTDATGAAVPNAKVTATQLATNTISIGETTGTGDYTFPALSIGTYLLRVEKDGFKAGVAKDVVVFASGTLRIDVRLEIGTTQQSVEISANAAQVQTENAKIQTSVANKLVDELPLVVGGTLRNPFDLALLAPEAKAPNNGDTNFAIGGGQAGSWGMTLDGVTSTTGRALQTSWAALNSPPLDAINEFTVESNGFKAEYGRAQGGVMSFVSKSGTNKLHGNAFEFLRNDALDAAFYNKALGKPVYKQHDFGFTVGGPVWIPKLFDGRNKSFFFVAYEGFRNRVGANPSFLSVAPAEFFTGDLRNWVDASNRQIPIYDPETERAGTGTARVRDVFPNNQIPASRIDPIARAANAIGSTARPNVSAAAGTSAYVRNNFIQSGTQVSPFDKFMMRFDHNLNESHRLGFTFMRNSRSTRPGANGPVGLPGFLNGTNFNNTLTRNYRLSWDWTISPTKINRFYAGGNDWKEINRALAVGAQNWKDVVCLANVPDCNNNFLNVGFAGDFNNWGGPSDNGSENNTYSFNDDFTLVSGKHTFKIGGQYEMVQYNGFGQQNIQGFVDFNRRTTGVPGDTNQATGGGSSFASYLLGLSTFGNIHTPRYIPQRFPYYGAYFQDDWRVNNKLTVNFGLRYDVNVSPYSALDNFSDFSPTTPNPGANNRPGGLIFAGFGENRQNRRRLVDTWFGGWGPRLSMAYSLDSKTVIRAGFGRTFAAVRAVGGSAHFAGFVQIFDTIDVDPLGFQPDFRLRNGFPSYPVPPFLRADFSNYTNVDWWQGNEVSRSPENLTYTFNVQRQVSNDMVAEIGWNFVRGTNLQSGILNYNQVNPDALPSVISPFTAEGRSLLSSNFASGRPQAAGFQKPFAAFPDGQTLAQSLRPFAHIGNINTAGGNGDRSGHSKYHALVMKLEKRYSSGLTFLTSYVFSKILTDSDSAWVGGSAMNHYARQLEFSIGQLDQTHNLKLSYVYEIPFGKGKRWLTDGVGNWVLGGWRLGAVHTYASGTPVGMGTTIGFPIFAGGNRPTVSTYEGWRGNIAGDRFDPFRDRYIQPASFFGTQPTDRFGNMTRFNPNFRFLPNLSENLSLAKSFPIRESIRMDFRAEAFNIFNRTLWGGVGGAQTLQNENFGIWRNQINDPRRLQLALKLYF
jgi:hypothetical protein